MSHSLPRWLGHAIVGLLSLAVGATYLLWQHERGSGHHDRAPVLGSSYHDTIELIPSSAPKGSFVSVELANPVDSDVLMFTRWQGSSYRETHLLAGNDWTELSGSLGGFSVDTDGSSFSTFSFQVPRAAQAGQYKVCSAIAPDCGLFTIGR